MKEELQKLINDGKQEDAFNLFKKHFLSDENVIDSGQLLAHLFESYVDSINSINKEEDTALEEIHAILQEIKKTDDASARDEVLSKLKEKF